ncbi:hypothetical protein ACFU93_32425 [Streptomyces sp. NPDC057611]|uniref:hypothetical protein n=1 Tax=Streptomyces sp. NPDC057611 TaxID=3346182 RepID=UPI00368C11A5
MRAWRVTKRGARFVADTLQPDSANENKWRRLGRVVILGLGGLATAVAAAVLTLFINDLTSKHEAKTQAKAEDDLNVDKGYIHASIRLKPHNSYNAPFDTFCKERLTPRQVEGFKSGEYYDPSIVKKNGVAAIDFVSSYADVRYGQIHFVDLVSDSSAMITVTGIDAVNVKCRKSEMVADVESRAEGMVDVEAVAYKLQDQPGSVNGLISDPDDKYGDRFFDHHTITLGGGADAQSLSVLGVAKPGTYCTWDLEAQFTTDDGAQHRAKLNTEPLTAEGGPAEGPGTQRVSIIVQNVLRWACEHGQRAPELCEGQFPETTGGQ